jgi:hypothetical protein
MELLRRRYLLRVYQHRERQVLSPFALPRIRAAPASRRLVFRNYTKGMVISMLLQPPVRRIRFVNMYDFPFHVCKVTKKI